MKRVSVFAPLGTLDHQTGIMNAIDSFAMAGYDVEVYAVRNRRFPEPKFRVPAVRVRYFPWRFNSLREPRALVTLLFSVWILLSFWRSHPLIFAGGIRGLFAAYFYSLFRRTRFVNYQTELYVGAKLDTVAARVFKWFERRAAQRAIVTIEHGEERRQLLASDLQVPLERIVIVPNSPMGPARIRTSNLVHRKLHLDDRVPLLLCPGTLGEAFESSTVVRAAQFLPPEWCCVLHSPQPRPEKDDYLAFLRTLDVNSRVLFSLSPVPYSQVDEIMSSARIGIALYSQHEGENYSTVGLASGKLSHFLKVGVPVIVSPLKGLADFVREHRVGEILEAPEQLGELIAQIESDAAGYRQRAVRCFDECLAYERSFRKVLAATDGYDRHERTRAA